MHLFIESVILSGFTENSFLRTIMDTYPSLVRQKVMLILLSKILDFIMAIAGDTTVSLFAP